MIKAEEANVRSKAILADIIIKSKDAGGYWQYKILESIEKAVEEMIAKGGFYTFADFRSHVNFNTEGFLSEIEAEYGYKITVKSIRPSLIARDAHLLYRIRIDWGDCKEETNGR